MTGLSRTVAAILAFAFVSSQAVQAGTVYVPLSGVTTVGSVTYETQVSITNSLAQQRPVKYFQIATGTDGTKRGGDPISQAVGAGRTSVLKPPVDFRGLLELIGPSEFQFAARLVGTGAQAGIGVELPVISSETMASANDSQIVQGLKSGGTQKVDFVVVNLGKTASTCTLTTLRADGTQPFAAATVTVPPLSHRIFLDIFGAVEGGIIDARVIGSCSNGFYLYAQMSDSATGDFAVATPTATGESSLVAPGEEPAGLECSTGTVCYVFPGLVHHATRSDPDHGITLTPPLAAYSSVKIRLEVEHGGWASPASGGHGVLYAIVNNNKDMVAYAFLAGPNKNKLILRHGFNQTHGQKARHERPFAADAGDVFIFEYEFNPVARHLELVVSRPDGTVLERIVDRPNVNRVHIETGDQFLIGLSNPGQNPVEPPSFNWKYSNLKVEFFP